MAGWIKLDRKIKDWQWFSNSNMVHLFLVLLLKANHKLGYHQGTTIFRGQLKTSLEALSSETTLSIQTIRTCLNRLKSTGEITSKSTNKYRIITITNYDTYQEGCGDGQQAKEQAEQQTTNKQLTIKQQTTNNKQECKEEKEEKESKKKIVPGKNVLFEKFWEEYHSVTEKTKTDRKAALTYWNKLSTDEKNLAIEKISDYACSNSNKIYLKKARTYLADKNFEDEFPNKHEHLIEQKIGRKPKYYDLYVIPNDDLFGYPESKLIERCNMGVYPKNQYYA